MTRDAGTTPALTSASRVARDPQTTRAARRMPARSRTAIIRASGERGPAPGSAASKASRSWHITSVRSAGSSNTRWA